MNPTDTDYLEPFNTTASASEEYESFSPTMDDEMLVNMLVKALDANKEHWNKRPWALSDTDKRNIDYLIGQPAEPETRIIIDGEEFVNNRLFTSVRAILSYATGQVAQPEIGPSSNEQSDKRLARGLQLALYEHSVDEDADIKFRVALLNLITRKRAFLKLRYDPYSGADGDIVTDICNPEDIIVDRYSKFNSDPNIIYHRNRCTVDELVAMFPTQKSQILYHFSIERADYTQRSRMVDYYEAWFTYMEDNLKQQGVAWFLPGSNFILDKMKNPNWIYKGNYKAQMRHNVTNVPPKPFINFNYFNLGRSYIDETCLFDQAVPLQKLINKRIKQITDNADYVNGRWIMNKAAVNEDDAKRFVNKGTNTTLLVDSDDVGKSVINVSSSQLPAYIYQSLLDARNELDTIMGTPSQFRGETPSSTDTLGRDQMVKQQAGMLQDDLVRAVNNAYKRYYKLKLQMMAVYYTEDHKFSQKGGDGAYIYFVVNEDNVDRNAKVGVQVDSTLPLDKASIRASSMNLAKLNRIDNLTLFEDLGLPDPEIRAERVARQTLDPLGYMKSMEADLDNSDAELDINLVLANKTPSERDNYDQDYITHWNNFMASNKFAMIQRDDPKVAQRLIFFLQFAQQKAQQAAQLQATQAEPDQAGLLPFVPPQPPAPKVTITGQLDPQDSEQAAGIKPPESPMPQQPDAEQLPTNVNPSQ